MDLLILSSKKDVIKKAFGSNSTLFKYNSKDTVECSFNKQKLKMYYFVHNLFILH
nr:hypothetical protein [Mycoplasmopsis bovis]